MGDAGSVPQEAPAVPKSALALDLAPWLLLANDISPVNKNPNPIPLTQDDGSGSAGQKPATDTRPSDRKPSDPFAEIRTVGLRFGSVSPFELPTAMFPKTEQEYFHKADVTFVQMADHYQRGDDLRLRGFSYAAAESYVKAAQVSDRMPVTWLRELRDKMVEASASSERVIPITRYIELPTRARLAAAAQAAAIGDMAGARQFMNRALRLNPDMAENPDVQKLDEFIKKRLRPVEGSKDNLVLPVVTVDGQEYEDLTATADDMTYLLQKFAPVLNRNHDRFLGHGEVDSAVIDSSINGIQSHFVTAMKLSKDKLQGLSNDENGTENDGVTVADMQVFDKMQKDRRELERAIYYISMARHNFAELFPGRKEITYQEVDQLAKSRDTDYRTRPVFEMLVKKWIEIDRGKVDAKALEQFITEKKKTFDLLQSVDTALELSRETVEVYSAELFADKNDPIKSITPDGAKQGLVGDCYFIAALASLAQTNPKTILDMVKQNEDGTFTVAFPGAPKEPITVSMPTESERTLYARPSEQGIWAAVIEKAYGEYTNSSRWRRGLFTSKHTIPTEATDGGTLKSGLKILTGRGVDEDINAGESTVRRKLMEAFASGRPVTAAVVRTYSTYDLLLPREDGLLISNHAYSVIAYDDATRTVTVRNPWGADAPVNGDAEKGTFKLSLSAFTLLLGRVAYGE